jgi:hypothetical protein
MKTQNLSRKYNAHYCSMVLLIAVFSALWSSSALAQGRESKVSPALRRELLDRVLADNEEIRDCLHDLSSEERGAFQQYSDVEAVDLNHDGSDEYEITGQGTCACGAQNCPVWIYRRTPDGFTQIFNSLGVECEILKTSHNGFDDITVSSHDSAATQYRSTYTFNGKEYKEGKSQFVNLETGQIKPAEVRIHFKRGTSSTTLTGKVSRGFPDTYVIGAHEGQTMTVDVIPTRGAVEFTIMGPEYASVTEGPRKKWTGKLPASGDFRILVDAERSGTYQLVVSIN